MRLAVEVGAAYTRAALVEGETRLSLAGTAVVPSVPSRDGGDGPDLLASALAATRALDKKRSRAQGDSGPLLVDDRPAEGLAAHVTSSAGGGLQMLVVGVIAELTAQSAERAALGAGADIVGVVSIDDGRPVAERIEAIRSYRPDIVLLSGGTNRGNLSAVAALAEQLAAARLRPRLFPNGRLPLIYAGNVEARPLIQTILEPVYDVFVVENLRPTLEEEQLEPTRREIHRLYLEHVMADAPRYRDMLDWSGGRIEPAPRAVAQLIRQVAESGALAGDIVAVDIGSATTNVYSAAGGLHHRSASSRLGIGHSVDRLLGQAQGWMQVARWLPSLLGERRIRNVLASKSIRPLTLPESAEELIIEQAAAREVARLAMQSHRRLAAGLRGVQQRRTLDEAISQPLSGQPAVDPVRIAHVIGMGGVLVRAPKRSQALSILLDGVGAAGLTEYWLDVSGLAAALGTLIPATGVAAARTFVRQLVSLGTVLAPVGDFERPGRTLGFLTVEGAGARLHDEPVLAGQLRVIPLEAGEAAMVVMRTRRGVDVGSGPGRQLVAEVRGRGIGLVIDARGRPLTWSKAKEPSPEWAERSAAWGEALDIWPPGVGR